MRLTGGPLGPVGSLGGARLGGVGHLGPWGPLGYFRSYFEWMAISSGWRFRLDGTFEWNALEAIFNDKFHLRSLFFAHFAP